MILSKPTLEGGAITNGFGIDAGGNGTGFFKNDGSFDSNSYALSNHNHSLVYAAYSHTHSYDNYGGWLLKLDGVYKGSLLSNNYLDLVGGTDVGLTFSNSGTTRTVTIDYTGSSTDTNNYVNNISFNTTTGNLVLGRSGLTDLTQNLDGRYSLTTHTHSYDNYGGWNLYVDNLTKGIISQSEVVNFIGGTNVTLDYNSTNNSITINSSATSGGDYVDLTTAQTVAGIKTFTSRLNVLNANLVVTGGDVSAQGGFDTNGSFICNTSGGFKITGKTSDDILLADGSTTSLSAIGGMVYDITTSTGWSFPFGIRNTSANNPAYIGFTTTTNQWACGADDTYFNILRYDSIGSGSASSYMRIDYATGDTIFGFGDLIAVDHVNTSDRRIKKNIKDYNPKKINVRWREYDLKESNEHQIGVIADELEETNPEFVKKGLTKDDMDSVRYMRLLIAKVAELEARLEKIE